MILVQHVLEHARQRLAVLGREASVCDAAGILANENTPLVVVCDGDGTAVGVVSRTDVVRVFPRSRSDAVNATVESIMTRVIHSCHADQTLQSVWANMGARGVRCTPVLDSAQRPQGILHARDIARALLDEVTNEELLLRDYVLGIGYQ